MKIAWFTPFNKESAIGKYSKCAVEVLSKWMEIDLFVYCEEHVVDKDAIMHNTFVNKVYYSSLNVISELQQYDLCIYNMGDNINYHGIIFDVLQLYPGVVIAHDICMHNFMRGYYLVYKNNPQKYFELLNEKYGEKEAAKILTAANSVQEWQKVDLLKYNFLEDVLRGAKGVIVHSQYHKKFVDMSYQGPILVTPLLYLNEIDFSKKSGKSSDREAKTNILTVGVVNPNKHIDVIIKAIGESTKIRKYVKYTVIGSLGNLGYVNQLRELIKRYQLEDEVELLDYVEDTKLQQYYQQADLITNLRYPALEGGSASLVEQMQWGKAIIAADTGVYAEIPKKCIFKVNPNRMEEEVRTLLETLVVNTPAVRRCEKNALEFANKRFSLTRYVENAKEFFGQLVFCEPLHEVMEECNKFTCCMEGTEIFTMLAEEMEELYAKG